MLLLTSLLPSASSLAVPSVAQKQSSTTTTITTVVDVVDQLARSTLPSSPFITPAHHYQQQQQQQHGYRRADSGTGGPMVATEQAEANRPPDLYNLTLTAMRHFLRHQLNESRYGAKAPRKRSHLVHVDDVDVEFYRRFKEFNSSQAALDGMAPNFTTQYYNHQPTNTTTTSTSSSSASNHSQILQETGVPAGVGPAEVAAVHPVVAAPSSSSPLSGATNGSQRDYSVLMDDPRGYITASSSLPARPDKSPTAWNVTFARQRGYIYVLVSFSVICAIALGLFGVFRYLRASTATRATEALTLPIQFITEDLAPLDTDLNHLPVPMLSVQSPGCAGMERLGVPARGSIGSPPLRDERTRRLRVESGVVGNSDTSTVFHHSTTLHGHHLQQQQQQQQHQQQQHPSPAVQAQHQRSNHDLILSSTTSTNFKNSNPPSSGRSSAACLFFNHHHHHHHHHHHNQHHHNQLTGGSGACGGSSGSTSINNYKTHYSNSSSYGAGSSSLSSSNSNNPITTSFRQCTHHVPLPDGEYGPDRDLQIRTPCQQSEIPRTYVKAPPNKTVRDVPVQYQSTGAMASSISIDGSSTGHLRGSSSVTGGASLAGGFLHTPFPVLTTASGTIAAGSSLTVGGRLVAPMVSCSTGQQQQQQQQQQKSDKLPKFGQILRFLPGNKSSKSSPSSSSSSSSGISSSGINSSNNNHHQNSATLGSNNNFNNLHPSIGCSVNSSSSSTINNNHVTSSSVSVSYGPNSVSNAGMGGLNNHINNNGSRTISIGSNSAAAAAAAASGGSIGTGTGSSISTTGSGRAPHSLVATTGGANIHNHNQHYRSSVAPSGIGAVTPVVHCSTSTTASPSTAPSSTSSSCSAPSTHHVRTPVGAAPSESSGGGGGGGGAPPSVTPSPPPPGSAGSPSMVVTVSVSPSPDPHAHFM